MRSGAVPPDGPASDQTSAASERRLRTGKGSSYDAHYPAFRSDDSGKEAQCQSMRTASRSAPAACSCPVRRSFRLSSYLSRQLDRCCPGLGARRDRSSLEQQEQRDGRAGGPHHQAQLSLALTNRRLLTLSGDLANGRDQRRAARPAVRTRRLNAALLGSGNPELRDQSRLTLSPTNTAESTDAGSV